MQVSVIGNAGGGDEEAFNVRNIRFEAGNAVAYGMDWDAALRSITLTPAETFGVADRVGSLAPGRSADVVIWSGDPLEFATEPVHVFIAGREVTQPSRQDLLEAAVQDIAAELPAAIALSLDPRTCPWRLIATGMFASGRW